MPVTLPFFYKKEIKGFEEKDSPPRRSKALWIVVAIILDIFLAASAIIISDRLTKRKYIPPEEVPAYETHLVCQESACIEVDGPGEDECTIGKLTWSTEQRWLCALNRQTGSCVYEYELANISNGSGTLTVNGEIYRNSGDEQINEDVAILVDGSEVFASDDYSGSPEYESIEFEIELEAGEHTVAARHGDVSTDPSSPGSVGVILGLEFESPCLPPEPTHQICSKESCIETSGEGIDECSTGADCIPPTHKECIGEQCATVEGEGIDECATDSDCFIPLPQTHKECVNEQCADAAGTGVDECVTDSDCLIPPTPTPTHKTCVSNSCLAVSGAGSDTCSTDSNCVYEAPRVHKICGNGQCLEIPGEGDNECVSNNDCQSVIQPTGGVDAPAASPSAVPATAWINPTLTILFISLLLVILGITI